MQNNSPSWQLERILTSLEAQDVAFPDVKEQLKVLELPTAISWAKLKGKLLDLKSDDIVRAVQGLTTLLVNHVTSGEKELHIFNIEPSVAVEIEKAFQAATPPDSIFSENFPRCLSATQLGAETTELVFTRKIIRSNGDISLFFCAKRIEYEKTQYKYNEVGQAVQDAFGDFDRFIAIKKKNYQIFECATFRKSTLRVEIAVDQPRRMSDNETPAERALSILGLLAPLSPALSQIYTNNSPINLYNCISSIYRDKAEGAVKSLSFRAPSRSNKKESVFSDDDLRKEPFHAAGIAEVVTITPYDIRVAWPRLLSGTGTGSGAGWAHIKTSVHSLSNEGAYVSSATVHAQNDAGFAVIANKLVKHSD